MIGSLFLAASTFLFSPNPCCPRDALLPAAVIPQTDKNKGAEDEKEKYKPVEYPPLSPLHKEKIKRLYTKFKNRNPKKRKAYEKDMIAIGRSAIPSLIKNGTTGHEEMGECIYNCLSVLMDERDVVTLKTCYQSEAERLRLLAVVKIGAVKDPDLLDFLKEACKDESPKVRLEAGLGCAALGDASGVGEIIMKVSENRRNPPPRIMECLPNLKNHVYGSMFTPYLVKHDEPEVRIAAAHVIAEIGDRKLKSTLGRALNDHHNLVKTAAVNALRKLVNGEEPREFKNVFDLVEAVNKWKKELGEVR